MFPSPLDVPEGQRARGAYRLRFEDLMQDGRLQVEAIVCSIGAAVWRPLLSNHPAMHTFEREGIRAIFTRLVVERGPARVPLFGQVSAEGRYELAFEPGPDGAATRLYVNMWTEITESGGRGVAARLFAEHVLTRVLAKPGERRVTEVPGVPRPETVYRPAPPESLLTLEEGAEWTEPGSRADAGPTAFGLLHTDPNQHVNSLVYTRLFEEAALRRLRALGQGTRLAVKRTEIAFRKPFFAGDAAIVVCRAFREGGSPGASGGFVDAGAGEGSAAGGSTPRPHAYVRMTFEE